jgi:uncharacterized membrane protein
VSIRRHPLHPALAHFPVALWIGTTAANLIAPRTEDVTCWHMSRYAAVAGTLMGALTRLAGLLELWLRAGDGRCVLRVQLDQPRSPALSSSRERSGLGWRRRLAEVPGRLIGDCAV